MQRTISGLTDLDHNQNIASALAKTIILWSLVETHLKGLFIFLTGIGFVETDGIFVNITGLHSKIQILKTLVSRTALTERQKKTIISALNKVSRLAKTRNKYVHHTWWLDEDRKRIVLMNSKFKPGEKGYLTNVNAGNITTHNKAVQRCSNALIDIFFSLRGTYLGKSFEPLVELQGYLQNHTPQNNNQKP